MNNIIAAIYPIIGSIVGFIVGTLAWHITEYIKRRHMSKQRVWDILSGK